MVMARDLRRRSLTRIIKSVKKYIFFVKKYKNYCIYQEKAVSLQRVSIVEPIMF